MVAVLLAAAKLIEGKPFSIVTDNQDTIAGFRSIAHFMGADIDEISEGGQFTKVTLKRMPHQAG
jgi:TusA-related sulfurtransferase